MSVRPSDELQNGVMVIDDNYEKLCADIVLLIDRLRVVKNNLRNTSWYHIGTKLKLLKEFSCIEKESDKILERLKRLDTESRNPIQMVKRS